MKILVTGSSGFIGHHTAQALMAKGHNVVGIDNETSSRTFNALKNPKFYKCDIRSHEHVQEIMVNERFDAVIHLAARAGVMKSMDEPDEYVSTNISGFYNVIKCAKDAGVKKFIYASSSSVYGDNNDNITKSIYADSKRVNEDISYSFSDPSFRVIGFRFFTVYGPWGRPEMSIYKWTKSMYENEHIFVFDSSNSITRNYTYITDVTANILAALKDNQQNYKLLDIAGPDQVSLIQAVNEIKSHFKTFTNEIKIEHKLFFDVESCQPDHPCNYGVKQTTFKQGVEQFVKWYKSFRYKGFK